MSNGETAFKVAREHCGVAVASIGIIRAYCACVSECPYLHEIYLSKMVTIKCNLETSVTKYKFRLGFLFKSLSI